MPSITIPDVPDEIVAAVDANARRAGLPRDEYMHRLLLRERDRARAAETPVPEDPLECLRRLAETYADARDPEIMAGAWR